MSLPSTSFAKLIIVAVPLIAACSFDANRLRGQPHKDAESPFDQGSADGATTGTDPDVSPASTSPLDGGGAQDTPPVGEDVRVSDDVFASGGAAGAWDGGGGSGGTVAFDGPTAAPLDAIGTGGTTSTGGATNTGGTTSTAGATNAGDTTSTAGATNAGGTMSTGGATNTDGTTSMGGATNAGGTMSTGGATNAGGTTSTGGATNAGGTTSTAGITNTGGTMSTGGATNTGGRGSRGGTNKTGGTTSTGGSASPSAYCTTYTDLGTLPSTSTEQTSVPAAETCFRFAVTAAGEVIRGIQMSNCGTRTMTINSTDSGCTPASGCSVATSIARAADGFWYLQFSATTATATATTAANCSSTWWWYP